MSRVDEILRTGGLRTHFQPIVDLSTGAVVGHEALTRGPAGTELERPDLLFDAARAEGRLADLDAACRRTAFEAAERSGIRRPGARTITSAVRGQLRDPATRAEAMSLVMGRTS